MSLNEMQIFLNDLDVKFSVFVYPKQEQVILRIPYKNSNFKDIVYDMNGNYVRNT